MKLYEQIRLLLLELVLQIDYCEFLECFLVWFAWVLTLRIQFECLCFESLLLEVYVSVMVSDVAFGVRLRLQGFKHEVAVSPFVIGFDLFCFALQAFLYPMSCVHVGRLLILWVTLIGRMHAVLVLWLHGLRFVLMAFLVLALVSSFGCLWLSLTVWFIYVTNGRKSCDLKYFVWHAGFMLEQGYLLRVTAMRR
eukprot:gene13059-8905_t